MGDSRFTDIDGMRRAINLSRNCVSEKGKASPAVGAVVARDGAIIAEAYRGEVDKGEHAEYTALERKLAGTDLAGATVYTTLEPCTTRNHPKLPCADRLVERKVAEIVVGMLDPDPRIYSKGCERLRARGVNVRYFPKDLRDAVEEINRDFILQFCASPKSSGTVRFDYTNSNGVYTIGHGDYLFETMWTKAGNTSIYIYNDLPSIARIAIALGAADFRDVVDAGVYNASSRSRVVTEGQIAVLQNNNGFFALVKVREVFDRDRPPDDRDELIFDYRILTDRTSDFSVVKGSENSDFVEAE